MGEEAVIIGGGPAGSATAIALSRRGVPVRLLERKADAHHKVCGEFISVEAAHYLAGLGVNLAALGAEPIHNARFYNGESELNFPLPFTAWSLSRYRLDHALLEQAELAGAAVELGTTVRHLAHVDDGWELLTRNRFGHRSAMSANTVFLATGKHELRDWKRRPHAQRRSVVKRLYHYKRHHDYIGFKMHFSPSTWQQHPWQDTVEVHLFNGGYAGLEPIEQGGVNLSFLIRQDIYKACGGDWPGVLGWLSETSSHMKQRLADLTPCWHAPLAISSVPYGYLRSPGHSLPGLFPLGDQAAVIPSFAGDGIAIALHTALLAARIYTAGDDTKAYQRLAYADLTRPVRHAEQLANLLSYRLGRKAAFMCARRWPALLSAAALRTRIRV
ncbi:NAD(P)/FAD-dependent oxidoreductase [Vreelandella sp. V005]|uniref:NAD(P)/FAD-dependent oxidoreductase n=1 Tax=Vreelandella sp. V005 TaxID=3459608 RepID=UPI004044A490